MPPTSEIVPFKKSRAERKVSVRYVDVDGRRQEKQMPFSEFQSFCIAWYAEVNSSKPREDRKSPLVTTASIG